MAKSLWLGDWGTWAGGPLGDWWGKTGARQGLVLLHHQELSLTLSREGCMRAFKAWLSVRDLQTRDGHYQVTIGPSSV